MSLSKPSERTSGVAEANASATPGTTNPAVPQISIPNEARRIVAIDGPAGAGKSTIASRLAQRFGLLNLESGAMYRAFALKALQNNIESEDAAALEALSRQTIVTLEPGEQGNRVLLDGADVTLEVRDPLVTQAASKISVHPAIRTWLVSLQRAMGERGGVVMEGRDIGTAVFPDADVKIFLDASPEARSQRRYAQTAPGAPSEATAPQETQASVLAELRERDERDRNRAQSPLRPAADAVIIDSTFLTLDQATERIAAIVEERWR